MTGEWIAACTTDEVSPDKPYLVVDEGIAVFQVDDEYFAIADRCSHSRASLSDGYIDGDVVECPYHFAKFCIRDGRHLSLPATKGVASYPTRVDGTVVHVGLAQPSTDAGAAGDTTHKGTHGPRP